MRKGDINEFCAIAFCKNLLPFHLIDDEFFRALLWDVPHHRTTLSTTHLSALYVKFLDALKVAVADQSIHLLFDLWKPVLKATSFLVSTAQWIDEDWNMNNAGFFNYYSKYFLSISFFIYQYNRVGSSASI